MDHLLFSFAEKSSLAATFPLQYAEGNRVPLYAKTREELYDKEMEALEQNDNSVFHRKSPTVAEYCEKWLMLQSVHVRANTLIDYTDAVAYLKKIKAI